MTTYREIVDAVTASTFGTVCCPVCDGAGEVDMWNPPAGQHTTVECVHCKGRGAVPSTFNSEKP